MLVFTSYESDHADDTVHESDPVRIRRRHETYIPVSCDEIRDWERRLGRMAWEYYVI